jgi:hypothetical protein
VAYGTGRGPLLGEIQDGKVKKARKFAQYAGELAEWLKAHAWKACVPQGTVSSNLTLSARSLFPRLIPAYSAFPTKCS